MPGCKATNVADHPDHNVSSAPAHRGHLRTMAFEGRLRLQGACWMGGPACSLSGAGATRAYASWDLFLWAWAYNPTRPTHPARPTRPTPSRPFRFSIPSIRRPKLQQLTVSCPMVVAAMGAGGGGFVPLPITRLGMEAQAQISVGFNKITLDCYYPQVPGWGVGWGGVGWVRVLGWEGWKWAGAG